MKHQPLFPFRAPLCPAQGSKLKVQGSRFPGSAILYALSAILVFALCGCAVPRPLQGGKAVTARTPGGAISQVLLQGENPSVPSRQSQETIKTRTYSIPAGSLPGSILNNPRIQQSINPDPNAPTLQRSNAPTVFLTEREETRAHTELGAAQKDTTRELGAKLSSLKSIVWVGVALFVFGLASFAWPPLKAIIGSVTTSAAITLGGVALMILPTLVVGHELLILGGVAVAVGAWFLAHRHGRLHGELSATTRHLRNLWNS